MTHTSKLDVCRTVKFFHLFLSIPQISAQGRWIVIIRLPSYYIVPKVSARPILHPSNKICEALDGGVTGSCASSWINKHITNKIHLFHVYIVYSMYSYSKSIVLHKIHIHVMQCSNSHHFNLGEKENGRFLPMLCLSPCYTEVKLIPQESFWNSKLYTQCFLIYYI